MTEEFFSLYKDLQAGVQAISFVDPYMQQPVFAARDAARERLEEIVSELVAERRASGKEYGDALETFMQGTYKDGSYLTDTELTGLIIATMFAGHHTSSGTGAGTLLEIAKNPQYGQELVAELDEIYQNGEEISHASMRAMPVLESFVNEVLRMHPPLVILMRRVMADVEYNGHLIGKGKTVAVSIYESHIDPEYFPDPHTFNPHRQEPEKMFAYIPFGGGRHKCAGSAFAILQLKAIFSALLRRYEFELIGTAEEYEDERSNMTIRPKDPCMLRYRRRQA
jgi:sterol 14-demethylase